MDCSSRVRIPAELLISFSFLEMLRRCMFVIFVSWVWRGDNWEILSFRWWRNCSFLVKKKIEIMAILIQEEYGRSLEAKNAHGFGITSHFSHFNGWERKVNLLSLLGPFSRVSIFLGGFWQPFAAQNLTEIYQYLYRAERRLRRRSVHDFQIRLVKTKRN